MKGTHNIAVITPEVRYEFKIKHKFTTVFGDSGSGKSYLCYLLRNGCDDLDQEVRYMSNLKARALRTEGDLNGLIEDGYNLILIDESVIARICARGRGLKFASKLKGTKVYFIIMSRLKFFSAVPFDVGACFRIESRRKNGKILKTFVEMYEWKNDLPIKPDKVVIEDSKVGFLFYSKTLSNKCMSAHGNSNIVPVVKAEIKSGIRHIFVIADGCAFGAYFEELLKIKHNVERNYNNVDLRLFVPPSFEYLVLASGIFKVDKNILENPQDYADVENFMSWEAMFTRYLMIRSGGKYTKNAKDLPIFLCNKHNQNMIYAVIYELLP